MKALQEGSTPPPAASEAAAAPAPLVGRDRPISTSPARRARRWFFHRAIRALMLLYHGALLAARRIGRLARARPRREAREILLTGRFESDNWVRAHLGPLAASRRCGSLWVVSTHPVPPMPKVVAVYPPGWLIRLAGPALARLLVFAWVGIRRRPDVVGGFHLLLNGLAAIALGSMIGARSMYFCVGGPPEVVDGAVWAGGPFANMETPDAVVERRLLRAVAACGTVITMGTRAAAFFREKGVQTDFRVVSGGIDSKAFLPATTRPSIDLIFTGRLVDIKRIDVFLEAVKHVARQLPDVRAVVVGDGQMRHALTQLAGDLGISHCVSFVGHQRDVGDWLRKSKLFVLTSDSEGLSLAMMEAMTCGLPAVVSNVGDLADMVEDGVNGYLVPRRSPETFAERIVELLRDEQKLAGLSRAARRTAFQHETASVMRQWDEILARERCT